MTQTTLDINGHDGSRRARLLLGAALIVLTALVHAPSLAIPFQFDDFHHLNTNPAIMSLANLPRFFTDPGLFSTLPGIGMYRPLLMVTHNLNYALFGNAPWGFRAVNIALHLLNTWMVFALLMRWTRDPRRAALAAGFWAVAAVNQIAVGYICARSSLLASCFMLGALLYTDRPERGAAKSAVVASVLFALALLSKEIAFVLPLLALMRDWFWGRERGFELRSRLPLYAALFALMPLYLVLHSALMGSALGFSYMPRSLYLLTQAKVFFYYLAKTLLPVNLTLITGLAPAPSLLSAPELTAAAAIAALSITALALRKRAPLLALGWCWILIALAPTSSLAPLFLLASLERMYLPLLGVALILLEIASRLERGGPGARRVLLICAAAVIVMNAAVTMHRHWVWSSQVRMMRDMVSKAPDKPTPWTWLALYETQDNLWESALKRVRRAVLIDPDDALAQEEMAFIFRQMGREIGARTMYEQYLARTDVAPEQRVSALLDLAALDVDEAKYDAAKARVGEALAVQPDNSQGLYLMGRLALVGGDPEGAKDYYRRALAIYPEYPEVWTQLGIMAMNDGDLAAAHQYLEQVIAAGYEWSEVLFSLGMLAGREGDTEKARQYFERALKANPNDGYAYRGLALYHARNRELETAREMMEKFIQLEPQAADDKAYLTLSRIYLDLLKKGGLDRKTAEKYAARAANAIRKLPAPEAEQGRKEWETVTGRTFP